jgi:hypothetical protein
MFIFVDCLGLPRQGARIVGLKERQGMALRRIAQILAMVALGCLAVNAWIVWSSRFDTGLVVSSLHEVLRTGAILFLSSTGTILALVATTLVLVALGQAQRWLPFRALLILAVLITLLGELSPLLYLFAWWLPLAVPDNTFGLAVQLFLELGPSALLAGGALAFDWRTRQRRRAGIIALTADPDFEITIEPLSGTSA